MAKLPLPTQEYKIPLMLIDGHWLSQEERQSESAYRSMQKTESRSLLSE